MRNSSYLHGRVGFSKKLIKNKVGKKGISIYLYVQNQKYEKLKNISQNNVS